MTTTLGEAAAGVLAKTPRPWDGKKIAEAGIYSGIPLYEYHGDICDGPSISSSGIRQIENESPLHFWDSSYLNPDRPEPEYKAHFALGSAAHTLLLGEDGFRDQYVIRPDEFPDWRTKASQQWRDGMVAIGKNILTPQDLETIKGIARTVNAEPLIRDGLFSGFVESSMFWQDSETGVWLKSRPDVINPYAGIVADLKTTASADAMSCRRSIAEFGYFIQLALAAEGYKALTGEDIPNDGFILVFVETKRPYAVNLKPVDAEAIWYGRGMIRRAIRTFAECLNTGTWPGYADSGVTAHLPTWLETRLKSQIESGELPTPETGKAA